jgi:signal transduction histidine kinase
VTGLGIALAVVGWLVAVGCAASVLRLRRRLERVAHAEHELRGPATAVGLAAAALRREPGGLRRALVFESQLERMRAGLADLEAARSGVRAQARPRTVALDRVLRGAVAGWRPAAQSQGRRLRMRWEGEPAAVRADPGRLAQAFGNLLANAMEHGSGPVELHGRTVKGRVLVEVRDAGPAPQGSGTDRRRGTGASREAGRGRGLAIAARAAEEAGGRLALDRGERGTIALVELPLRVDGGSAEP